MSNFRLPQRCKRDLHSSGVLRGVDLYPPTFGPIGCRKTSVSTILRCLTSEKSEALRLYELCWELPV
jgi:hypothetical protein